MNSPTPTLSRCVRSVVIAGVALASAAVAEVGSGGSERVSERLLRVQIPFVPNAGLTDPEVAFSAATFAGTTFITRGGVIVYSLPCGAKGSSTWTLTETAVNAGVLRPVGAESSEARVSFFLGNDPAHWRNSVETYRAVSLGEAWPGISLTLRAYGDSVEKVFTVGPGADASLIRMGVDGAKSLRLDRNGSLLASTGVGEVRFTAPVAFQQNDGIRREIAVRYGLEGSRYGFVLGDYDPELPLVIDPLLQSTYLGGGGTDRAYALAISSSSGEIYVAGSTSSRNFPGTAGGAQPANLGLITNVLIARLHPNLITLTQATYLGAGQSDQAFSLAIHPTSGDVYVAGSTSSSFTNFPGTAGGAQPTSGGGTQDGFVARLNSSLTTLIKASYLGGSAADQAFSLAIHPVSGEIYVAGSTSSADFPRTAGGAQGVTGGGSSDGFVSRLNPNLTAFLQASYLGGGGLDSASSVSIHPTSQDVYVAGVTTSDDLPGTVGGAQPDRAGQPARFSASDAFVVRLNASLEMLSQVTYLGGYGDDSALATAIHPISGDVYVAGTAEWDFPGTAGGAQPASVGPTDAFVARLHSNLRTLVQATYLAGFFFDGATSLAIDETTGDVYVAGTTGSSNFPGTAGGAQVALAGVTDGFVARLNRGLTTFVQTTYLGGNDYDVALAVALHPSSGDVYVTGWTFSTSFPGTPGGFQPAHIGGEDAFVARLSADLGRDTAIVPVPTLSTELLLLFGLALGSIALLLLRRNV